MERLVDDRLKRHNTSWDITNFERGRWDMLTRIKRIEDDLNHLIESLKEQINEHNGNTSGTGS